MLTVEIESLKKIKEKLFNRFGDSIVYMYAFGSRVRGDFTADSDFDVLIVVKNKTPQIEDAIIGLIVEEELKHGISFTPLIKDSKSFELEQLYNSPFYNHIKNEGIQL